MEIYNNLDTAASKEFEQLLNSQFTKTANLEEGKIISGTVNKVTDNFVFLEVPGLKSEPILDINELKPKNRNLTYNEVLKSIKKRDKSDYNRKISPLKKTEDSILINTTNLTKRSCFLKIKKIIDKKLTLNGNIQ